MQSFKKWRTQKSIYNKKLFYSGTTLSSVCADILFKEKIIKRMWLVLILGVFAEIAISL